MIFNPCWFSIKHKIIELKPEVLHSFEVLYNFESFGIQQSEIKEWAKQNKIFSNLSDEEIDTKIKEIKFCFGSEHEAEGLKLICLKHGNISIRKTFIGKDNTYKFIINYYGEKGFNLLKDFVIDYYDIFKSKEIITFDAKINSYFFFKNINELIKTF